VQGYTSGPQGVHAPVPHERWRAAQARRDLVLEWQRFLVATDLPDLGTR